MASNTTGAKGNTSKRDVAAPQRRFRAMYLLFMQGVIVVFLAILAWFSRGDTRALLLLVGTLVVPIGWSYAVWSAWQREEAARAERRFDAAFAKRERARGTAIMGVSMVAWVAILVAIYLLT